MTLGEAMHTECDWCGENAGHHRLTNSGNFYCLEPAGSNTWMRATLRKQSPLERKLWAQNRARCSELRKSPLSRMTEVANTILLHVRGIERPSAIADTLLP